MTLIKIKRTCVPLLMDSIKPVNRFRTVHLNKLLTFLSATVSEQTMGIVLPPSSTAFLLSMSSRMFTTMYMSLLSSAKTYLEAVLFLHGNIWVVPHFTCPPFQWQKHSACVHWSAMSPSAMSQSKAWKMRTLQTFTRLLWRVSVDTPS